MAEQKKQDYDLAFTHLKNNQNISAYHQFVALAEPQKKINKFKAAILYLLAGESKAKQGKDIGNELLEAGKLFLDYGKKDKSYKAKSAYLCASKCFLKAGKYDDAKKAFNHAKEFQIFPSEISRPIIIIEDSNAIVMKLQNFLKKLGYNDCFSFPSGKEGIDGYKKLIKHSKNPIILLDMGLPDIGGDDVATKLLDVKPDLQIILITADEKTTERVHKTISSGVSAFIQKPFTIDELKQALETVEKENNLSQ